MDPMEIHDFVRRLAPEHALHIQEECDGSKETLSLKCSCGVGLTILAHENIEPLPERAPADEVERGT